MWVMEGAEKRARKSMSRPDKEGSPPGWEGEEMKACGNARRKRGVWLGGAHWGDRGSACREAAPTCRVPAAPGPVELAHGPRSRGAKSIPRTATQASHQRRCLQLTSEGSPWLCLSFPIWPSPACCLRRETQTVPQKRSYLPGRAVRGWDCWGSHTTSIPGHHRQHLRDAPRHSMAP